MNNTVRKDLVSVDTDKLENVILEAGLSYYALSKEAGLSTHAISNAVKVGTCSRRTLKHIADCFGLKVLDLMR